MPDDNQIDKVSGQAKKTVGKAVGDAELEEEGRAQHGMAQAKEAVEDTVNKVQDTVKKAVNRVTGNGSE
jgi:uncharacterized protein YjbJ (UPF0337 family)